MASTEAGGSDLEDSVNIEIDGSVSTTSTPVSQAKQKTTFSGSCKSTVQVGSCPVKNVTVFLDRAEVNRAVEVAVTHHESEVVISGLPSVIDQDSVRVQCLGDATIVEVKYAECTLKDDEAEKLKSENDDKATGLKAKIEELEKEKNVVVGTLGAQEQKLKVLMGYSERVAQGNKDGDKVIELFEKKSLDNLSSFMTYLFTNIENINKAITTARESLQRVNTSIEETRAQLAEISPSGNRGKTDRHVSVLLESPSQCHVQLTLSYVVRSASWSPVYDLRAFSKDNILQLLYFGVIRQTTGEDWNDALIALSTAMPSVGGSAPPVPTKELTVSIGGDMMSLKSAGLYSSSRKKAKRGSGMFAAAAAPKSLMRGFLGSESAVDDCDEYSAMPTAVVNEGVTSTCFEILRPSTIKSDSSDNKVSISLIELTPEFEYEISPKLVAHAFLRATVKNESDYALLAGPANVFLDNNFLTKSALTAVSPGEKFNVSLGADPSVKVTYHPVKKFQHNAGIFTKVIRLNYEQKTTINNSKGKAVTVKVTDQLPKSNDERIKVHLTAPDIPPPPSKPDPRVVPPVQINSKNNIEWHAKLDAGAEKDFSFTYIVEYPNAISIDGL